MSPIPGLRRSHGGGHGNPFQYSYLENLMDRGAWWAIIYITKSQTQLSTHTHTHTHTHTQLPMICIVLTYVIVSLLH